MEFVLRGIPWYVQFRKTACNVSLEGIACFYTSLLQLQRSSSAFDMYFKG